MPYAFFDVLVYDDLGGAVRLARNAQRVMVTDPATGLTAAGLTVSGQPVPWVTSDAHGAVSFSCDLGGVIITGPNGLAREVRSTQYLDEVAAAPAAAQAAADSARYGQAAGLIAAYRPAPVTDLTVAIAGDTGWARDWATAFGASMPAATRREYRAWSGSAWTTTVDAPGISVPGSGGFALTDTFTRSGALDGSTPDVGPAWNAGTAWTTNGSVAACSGTMGAGVNVGGKDATVTASLRLVSTGTGSAQTLRVYATAPPQQFSAKSFVDGVWGYLTVGTTGAVTAGLVKTVGGVTTTLATCPTADIIGASGTTQAVTLTLTVSGTAASLTVQKAGGTLNAVSGSLTSGDVAALGTWAGLQSSATPPGITVDRIDITTPVVPAIPAPAFTVKAISGLDPSTIAAAFPASPAVGALIVAAAPVAAAPYLAAFRAAHPETVVQALAAADATHLTMPTAVDATIAALPTVKPSALGRLKTVKAFGASRCVVGVASDSTANDITDWVRIWHQKWGATLSSSTRRAYSDWNAGTSSWNAQVVDAAGVPADPGVIVDDTFSRTGEVVGSTPDTGPAWAGTAGIWTADGSKAKAGGTFGNISTGLNSRDQTATLTLSVVTTAPSVAQSLRVYVGATGAGTGLWAMLSLSTAGALTVQLWKSLPTNTSLAAAVPVAGAVTNSATAQTVTLSISTVIQAVTLTATTAGQTTTLTGTISEAETLSRGNNAFIGGGGAGGTFFAAIDTAHLQTPAADNPPPAPEVTIWNGATPGAGLTFFDTAKRAAMWGGKTIDVIVVAISHNQGSQLPGDYITELSAWVDAVRAEHPEAALLLVSQNPQYPPSAGGAAHRERLAALRRWASQQGYDYVGAYEAFAAYAGGGSTLVDSGGVHPTMPPSGTLTGAYGAVVWADTLTAALS